MVRHAYQQHVVLRPPAHPKKRGVGGGKWRIQGYEFKMLNRFDGCYDSVKKYQGLPSVVVPIPVIL